MYVYTEAVYYEYTKYILKTVNTGLKTLMQKKNKCVQVYAQSGSEKCVVWLLDFCPATSNSWIVRPLTKVPVDSKKLWYCRSRVEVQHPTWAFRRGGNKSFKWVYVKAVPEKLIQCTRVWMLFVHMSEPHVCEKKQLVSVYSWESRIKRHRIL